MTMTKCLGMINKSLLDYGIDYRGRWTEEIKTRCQKCSNKKKRKKNHA